jgi:hypothetical protein
VEYFECMVICDCMFNCVSLFLVVFFLGYFASRLWFLGFVKNEILFDTLLVTFRSIRCALYLDDGGLFDLFVVFLTSIFSGVGIFDLLSFALALSSMCSSGDAAFDVADVSGAVMIKVLLVFECISSGRGLLVMFSFSGK